MSGRTPFQIQNKSLKTLFLSLLDRGFRPFFENAQSVPELGAGKALYAPVQVLPVDISDRSYKTMIYREAAL